MTRHVALGLAAIALLTELGWLACTDGTVGPITAAILASIAVLTITAARIVAINTVTRILVGALFAGSVADRFGLFGTPDAPGVSWGSYSRFIDYTRTLMPSTLDWAAPTVGTIATVLEAAIALGLLLGIATSSTARAAAALLIAFATAMWTSVGFGEMSSYGVLVVAGGTAVLGTCDTAVHLDRLFQRSATPDAVGSVAENPR
ncbi:hypothetical protein [Nocardia sp. NBC_01009]|uniref:hypothetical protein n=1 Tax=Nocardia sp. NBC_01009 TaxID=2975996 RepID=UPI0038681185|nr:hypothetical protein OHA42_04125 [Nocardia sp. NBC_01009]